MKRYLSFSGGVDSTALLLLLLDKQVEFEAIFVDHGTDYPETYDYVKYINEEVFPITIIKPNVQGFWNLYDFCWAKKTLPSMKLKWCNDKFKMRPQATYVQRPCVRYLGFNANEKKRAKWIRPRKGEIYKTPLIEEGITKRMCVRLIRDYGLKVPPKSGCYFCPMQPLSEWKKLMINYPDLFKKAMALEDRSKVLTFFMDGTKLSKLWQENKLTNYLEAEAQ